MKEKWLLRGILKYRNKFVLAIILITFDGIATFLYPKYITQIIDIAIPYKDERYLLENILGLLLFSLLSLFANINISYLFYNTSNNFVFDIKKKMISGAFQYDGLKIKDAKDKFVTCMIEDVYMIEIIASQLLASMLLDIVTLGIIIFVMIKINVSVLIFVLLAYPFLLIMQFIFNRKIQATNIELMKARDKSNSLVTEFVDFLYQYIAYNGEKHFEKRFYKTEENAKEKKIEICMLKTYNAFLPQLTNAIAFALIVGFCAYQTIQGKVSVGELTIIIMYINQLSSGFIRIVMAVSEFQRIRISVKRIGEMI